MLNGDEDGEKVTKKKREGGGRKACKRLRERENREEWRPTAEKTLKQKDHLWEEERKGGMEG